MKLVCLKFQNNQCTKIGSKHGYRLFKTIQKQFISEQMVICEDKLQLKCRKGAVLSLEQPLPLQIHLIY